MKIKDLRQRHVDSMERYREAWKKLMVVCVDSDSTRIAVSTARLEEDRARFDFISVQADFARACYDMLVRIEERTRDWSVKVDDPHSSMCGCPKCAVYGEGDSEKKS